MSAFDYYKTLGEQQITPQQVAISNATLTTIAVWTPTPKTRIVVTSLHVSSNPGGTIDIYFGGDNQIRLAQFSLPASTTISPVISGWESTCRDAPLQVRASNGTTNGWSITAEGFELANLTT